jgi:hypothetical protein
MPGGGARTWQGQVYVAVQRHACTGDVAFRESRGRRNGERLFGVVPRRNPGTSACCSRICRAQPDRGRGVTTQKSFTEANEANEGLREGSKSFCTKLFSTVRNNSQKITKRHSRNQIVLVLRRPRKCGSLLRPRTSLNSIRKKAFLWCGTRPVEDDDENEDENPRAMRRFIRAEDHKGFDLSSAERSQRQASSKSATFLDPPDILLSGVRHSFPPLVPLDERTVVASLWRALVTGRLIAGELRPRRRLGVLGTSSY